MPARRGPRPGRSPRGTDRAGPWWRTEMQTHEEGQEGKPIVYANLPIEDEALLLRQCRLNKVSWAEPPKFS